MSAATPQPASDRPATIGARYTLRERLAQGGMGEVFRAVDHERGCDVALKRLRAGHEQHQALFRAEYHALARLKHPHIVEVHDFGVHDGRPFYTMDLLDGQDLLESPAVGVREACRMLRDVASSLALLHSQRLLHRDIGPRNVRRTHSGTCKLFDFGVMVPFGVPPNLAGTPPFVAPEAWEGSVLDQRADLYSLGALAYWLLTRTFPYEPKKAARVGVVGCPPPPPLRKRAPEVPEELEELVMSLLELDPVKRPSSAAEVIARLNQIAALPPDDTIQVTQGYFASARFVGRDAEVARVEEALESAQRGRGSRWLVGGPPGIGRTRFLQEVALRAQTRGMRVVRAFGARAHSNGELVREIYQTFRRMSPEVLEELPARDQAALRAFDGETRLRVPVSRRSAAARDALHASLGSFVHHATGKGEWLLLVDDLDLADRFSAAFVSSLARKAEDRSLVVLAAASGVDAREVDASAARTFAADAPTVWLQPLDLEQTRSLAASLFGDVPNLNRTAAWLYRKARGNPSLCLELCGLLLRRGAARYVEGTFLLPDDAVDLEVPDDLAHTLSLRLDPAGEDARKLAELVATCRGGATLELCLRASELDGERTLTALEELVRHSVLTSVRGTYTFCQDATRQALMQTLAPGRAQALHGRLAKAFLAEGEGDLESRLEAGWHLLHTDRELEGAHLLSEITPTLFATDLSYSGAINAAERALEVYERLGAPLSRRLAMRALLVRAGYLYDHQLAARYGQQTLDMAERWLTLHRLRPWVPRLGANVVLLLVLTLTSLRWLFTWGKARGPAPIKALQYLGRSGMSMLGVHALALDAEGTGKLLERFEVFRASPRGTPGRLLYLSAQALATQPRGREVEVREGSALALQELERRKAFGISQRERLDMTVGLLLSSGINEAYRVGSKALSVADRVDELGTEIGHAAAQRIRLTYHLVRGNREAAEHHRRMLEVHAIEGGTTWQVEWFAVPIEGIYAARHGDLVAARRSLERMEGLVVEVPSLLPLRDLLRLMYQHRRGNLELALRLGEAFVRDHPPRSMIGWPTGYAAYGAALNDAARFEQARTVLERAQASIDDAHREYATIYGAVERELAFTYAALDMDELSDALTRANLERYERSGETALLSMEYENVARIARLRGDIPALLDAVRQMREAADRSGSRFIVERTQRVASTLTRSLPPLQGESGIYPQDDEFVPDDEAGDTLPPTADDAGDTLPPTPIEGATERASVRSNGQPKARQILRQAMDQAGACCAFLFAVSSEGAEVTAAMGDEHPPPEVAQSALDLATSRLAGGGPQPIGEVRRLRTVQTPGRTYEVVLLPSDDEEARGVIALGHERGAPDRDLSESMLERLGAWSTDEFRPLSQGL